MRPSVRFDVFKRDGYTCVYCGSVPPDVVLEVDHVVPRAAGGGDEFDNLVTSCWECNRGKSATPLNVEPEGALEERLRREEELQERERQLRLLYEAQQERRERKQSEYDEVLSYWFEAWGESELEEWYLPWESFLRRAIADLGVPEVKDAIDITVRRFRGRLLSKAVAYFGGVIRNKRGGQDA